MPIAAAGQYTDMQVHATYTKMSNGARYSILYFQFTCQDLIATSSPFLTEYMVTGEGEFYKKSPRKVDKQFYCL